MSKILFAVREGWLSPRIRRLLSWK